MPPPKRHFQRNEGTRTPQDADSVYLSFSFRYLREQEPPHNPQSLETWVELLLPLLKSLKHFTSEPLTTLVNQQCVKIYNTYPAPDKTDFTCPPNLPPDIKWATLQRIGGQKQRVAGFILNQIFYIVFLDKDHEFWKSPKKHT